MKKWLLGACCLLPLLSGIATATATEQPKDQLIDRVVAVINDDVITQSELNHQTAGLKAQLERNNQPVPDTKELEKQVLNHIIDVNLQLQIAEKSGVTITDAKLDSALSSIAKRNHMDVITMRKRLEKDGMSYQEYRENIRKELILADLQREAVAKRVSISDDEVNEFIKQNHGQREWLYHLDDILIPIEENPTPEAIQQAKNHALELMKAIKHGDKSFKKTAIAESQSHTAFNGGDMGWRKLVELPEVFTDSVRNMQKGEVQGPIRTGNGFHIIRLTDKKLDDNTDNHVISRQEARDYLFRRKFEEQIESWVQRLRSTSYIKVLLDNNSAIA